MSEKLDELNAPLKQDPAAADQTLRAVAYLRVPAVLGRGARGESGRLTFPSLWRRAGGCGWGTW